ncbi:hypothetical protein GCM10029964_102390 [Kibdelosporangium lantanae]
MLQRRQAAHDPGEQQRHGHRELQNVVAGAERGEPDTPAINASEVRSHARNVRSLASENRGSGSVPVSYTLRGQRVTGRP